MYERTQMLVTIMATILCSTCTTQAITVQSSGEAGGPDAQQLAAVIADPSSHYFVVANSENTKINASNSPDSNPRAMGTFANGITAKGTLLPATNQNATNDAQYEGGLGISSGICLCTGLSTDNDSQVTGVPADQGVGVEGPNRGFPKGSYGSPGEIDFVLGKPQDADFVSEVAGGADATVLQFKITLTSPGFLSITFVHGSDEHPTFLLNTYNDTPLLFIGDANGQDFENIILFKDEFGVEKTLTLDDLVDCELLLENLVAPSPAILQTSPHADVSTTLHFDHEFGGFSKPLTRESKCVFAPGTYTIKLVIQDVSDNNLDSATFFEENSLKLYDFLAADFNLDGKVDGLDFSILSYNFNMTGAIFTDGDANGDGKVDGLDFSILSGSFGLIGGNANFCADFDRDGDVDGTDFFTWQQGNGLSQCASRSEGDADGDGDVDQDDLAIYEQETSSGIPSGQCGCEANQQAMAGGGGALASQATEEFESAEADGSEVQNPNGHPEDTDGDGDFDADDLANWGKSYGVEE